MENYSQKLWELNLQRRLLENRLQKFKSDDY